MSFLHLIKGFMKWGSTTISLVSLSLTLTVLIKMAASNDCNFSFKDSFRLDYGDSNSYSENDEGAYRDFKCSININLPEDCKERLNEANRQASAQLVINEVVQSNVSEVKSNIDGDYKIFAITRHYESHNNATFSCMTTTAQVNYTSNLVTISKIDEIHYLTLSSSAMKIVAGQNNVLNCTAENKRSLEMINWYMAVNDQKSNILSCDEDKQPVPCRIKTVEDPPSSLITVETSKDLEKSETYTV